MRPTQVPRKTRRATTKRVGLALLTLLATIAPAGTAAAQAPVPLRGADAFAILAGTTVTNTGPTIINGDLGVSPGTAVVGFPPGTVNGTIHSANATAARAQLDLTTAYNNAAGQPVTATIGTQLGGSTLGPGVYDSAAGEFNITGNLTLDGLGNPNAIFIFKTASTLVTAAGPGESQVTLVNGARSCNVFWQVGSSATLGTFSDFSGNVLALTSIAAQTSAVVNGRLLARNGATTLDSNTVTRARCDFARPTLTFTGVPTDCTARNFRMRIRATDPAGIDHTDVFLDGRRIKRSTKANFTVNVPAKGLKAGRHNIRVVATDFAGNQRVRKARFVRCGRAAASFTG